MTINERIRYLRKEKLKITLDAFGKKVGVTKAAVSDIERGRNNVTDQMFNSICREFGVNETWLRTGEGPQFVELTRTEEIQKMVDDIMYDRPESFRLRFVASLAALDESGWIALEKFIDSITDQKEIDTRKRLHDDLDRQLNEEEDPTEGSEASPAM
jgi:transcriptional regulator with XRE-family HTH domain